MLKYLDCKMATQKSEVPLSELVGDLRRLQEKNGLDMYALPKQDPACCKALSFDLSDLEDEGLVRSTRRSEPRYKLSPLGEYFCLLIETPEVLKSYVPRSNDKKG